MVEEVEHIIEKDIPIISLIIDTEDYNQEGWNQHGKDDQSILYTIEINSVK